ncbi:MAG: TRAM domain-containing protein [Candidatus Omnitrophica bacterium]|nr:TRAM domain-containing protein [Candidatus Omnitrophota bacterium]MCK5259625.1 TRAM domain-containing protein [Candidatus Omnitrophota bacterium]
MTLLFVRIFFLVLSAIVGYYIGTIIERPMLGLEMGALSGLVLMFLEQRLHRISLRGLSSMVFGLLLGVFMAKLISDILALIPLDPFFQSTSRVILTLIFSYLGTVVALRGKDEFNVIIPYVRFRRQDVSGGSILLDTSAIIDGRVADICKANFLTGRLVIPRCVLKELQKISDSADDTKRQRGRRGMELLRMMQTDPKIQIHIHEDELSEEKEVDAKLMKLAKILDARICTTDFNLGRIAALQGIGILNIHELGTAVKPVVYTGEILELKLIREGKEPGQALAYLEDGTMVVVSDARDLIGKKVTARVTSVLQTQTGKMIFAKLS